MAIPGRSTEEGGPSSKGAQPRRAGERAHVQAARLYAQQ